MTNTADYTTLSDQDLAQELETTQANNADGRLADRALALRIEQWHRAGVEIEDLTQDGDVIDLPDGRKLRLRIQPDDTNPFTEYETYGKVEWANRRYERQRPDGFDGNAEILNGAWWQPPADGPKRGTEEFAKFRQLVLKLIEFGMETVILEVLDGEDAYHRPIVTQVTSLGGIDSLEDGYLAEVVKELGEELGLVD